MLVGMQGRDAEARHLDTKLLPLSTEELDTSMLYILRNFGLARSLVLGMHSGIPSRSSKVDWRENSVVASVKALGDDGRCSDEHGGSHIDVARQFNHHKYNDSFDDFMDVRNGRDNLSRRAVGEPYRSSPDNIIPLCFVFKTFG